MRTSIPLQPLGIPQLAVVCDTTRSHVIPPFHAQYAGLIPCIAHALTSEAGRNDRICCGEETGKDAVRLSASAIFNATSWERLDRSVADEIISISEDIPDAKSYAAYPEREVSMNPRKDILILSSPSDLWLPSVATCKSFT